MAAADAVLFASPVYFFNVSTLMKNLIDLFAYQMHRPSFFGKKALVVVDTETTVTEDYTRDTSKFTGKVAINLK